MSSSRQNTGEETERLDVSLINWQSLEEEANLCTGLWPSVPIQLLVTCIDDLPVLQITGTASSDIFKAFINGNAIALKTFRTSATPTRVKLKKFYLEALLLSKLCHPNIIPFMGVYLGGKSPRISMITKFMGHGTLPQFLSCFPDADRLSLLEGVASAVMYLHALPAPIMHGDIRGANVVIGDDGAPYLIDLDCALIMDSSSSNFFPSDNVHAGNPRWAPPEKLLPGEFPLSLRVDVYSFACFCVEVFSGKVPFSHLVNDGAVVIEVLVRHRHPSRPEGFRPRQLTDTLWDVLESCFTRNPAARPSMGYVHDSIISQISTVDPSVHHQSIVHSAPM